MKARLLIACVVILIVSQVVHGQLRRFRIRVAPAASSAMLTINDLTWDGEYRMTNPSAPSPLSGGIIADAPALAVLYVGAAGACADTRRFLVPSYSAAYLSATVAATNPAQLTRVSHGFPSTSYVRIRNSTTTPSIDGTYQVTSTGADTFTIPVDLSAGVGGSTAVTQYPNSWGDLVEYCRPAASSYYTGATPESAPALIETGRWDGVEITDVMNLSGDLSSGNFFGGLWWDEAQGVLWMNIYGYYYGANMPSLMAVQLTHTAHATRSGYFQAGTRYGPWYYRDATPGAAGIYPWKGVQHGFMQPPASAYTDLGGRTNINCGAVGAVGGPGHLGLGFRAINLPALGTTPATVYASTDNSGVGLKLADYSEEFGPATYPNARRDGNYYLPSFGPEHLFPAAGLWAPDSASNPTLPGYWLMSMDQTNGCVWVETATKHGILSLGREVIDGATYGYSPLSETFRTIDAISNSGTTVSVTMGTHNMNTGTMVRFSCLTPTGYNGTFAITKVDADHFTYTSTGTLGVAGYSDYSSNISSISTGNPATVTTATAHGLADGMKVAFNSSVDAQTASGYLQGAWYTATVTGANTFTIPVNVTVAGTAVGAVLAATHDNGLTCATFGVPIAVGWDATVYIDQIDPGRGAKNYTNGYNGDTYRGILRGMNPDHIRAVARGEASPYNTDTNWSDLGDWHTTWPNIPEYRIKPLATDADESRMNLLSQNVNGMYWDATAKQIIWLNPASASNTFATTTLPPTLQFFSVP